MRASGRMLALSIAFLGAFAAPAAAQVQLPAKPQTDVAGLRGAEGRAAALAAERAVGHAALAALRRARLYALLGADRGDDLALAARRHAQPRRARRASAARTRRRSRASWWRRGAGELREPQRLALLERRALRTLTQGHLAQHIFFHSLHQNAIPDNAPAIFGVASREEFQALRRSELSPAADLPPQRPARARTRSAARRRRCAAMAARGVARPGDARPRRRERLLAASCARSRAGCSRRATTARRR